MQRLCWWSKPQKLREFAEIKTALSNLPSAALETQRDSFKDILRR